jgi:hypothetical protein
MVTTATWSCRPSIFQGMREYFYAFRAAQGNQPRRGPYLRCEPRVARQQYWMRLISSTTC